MLIKLLNKITGKFKSYPLDKLLSKRSKGFKTKDDKLDKPHGSNYGGKFSLAGHKVSSAYRYVRTTWANGIPWRTDENGNLMLVRLSVQR